ncbi:2-hydroxy-3-oxopropionate reductase [Catalinimonas alkaloidigena]|uniref:2-hydroxy-3-oxopropionate reductase n=1 Tax=Catalinimonas alkaloidigena TaxID=1075417 RepID=UPI00240520C9|nr:2-hydroxy-3-oxopropionate reductase [Catalinimonas alkaloidigena]MDF9796957.1 2-hydroxy-3-oxopropionate reductase [Catalinimonas alkaloidigena]
MEKIGFIGLGIMGKPMALNLVKAGYSLSVLKQSGAADTLTEAGAKTYASAKELAQENDVIITMLPDSAEVKEVVSGAQGVGEGIRKGSLFIDMSTIAPSTAKEIYALMQDKGVEALDAPVSGGQVGAESGTVSFMVGGNEQAFQRAKPLFEIMGKNVVRIGETGAGQTTKACNQIIVGMTIQAVAEAFTLAKKAGVDLVKMREALLGGFAQSRILDLHGQRIIDQNFKPGFKIKLHRKDMNIALQAGKEFSVPLYGSAQVAAHMDAILAQGNGELDHSAIAQFMEELSIHSK